MLVLAVESATNAAGVALADEDGVIVHATLSRGRRHAETIAPAIDYCCTTAGIVLAQVDALVVDVGPGLFTGLRVGVGTAKALAYALARPVVALPSLDVLARAATVAPGAARADVDSQDISRVRIVPVLDARRGEVVSAEFRDPGGSASGLERSGAEQLQTPEALAERLAERAQSDDLDLVLVGDGAIRYEAILRAVPKVRFAADWLASPPVAVLATMGVESAIRGEFQDPLGLSPRYVRQADARINWEKRAPRQVAGI